MPIPQRSWRLCHGGCTRLHGRQGDYPTVDAIRLSRPPGARGPCARSSSPSTPHSEDEVRIFSLEAVGCSA